MTVPRPLVTLSCLCLASLLACTVPDDEPDFEIPPDDEPGVLPQALPFSFRMAGALVKADDPLQISPAQLLADHFSYAGQYAVNGCANNNAPYSCAANGCAYPDSPTPEIPSYADLASWMASMRSAGLYPGIWGVSYERPEAEAHCLAEVANALHAAGQPPSFVIVDGEKSFETHQDYSARYVTTFNSTLAFTVAKAYTPECHTEVPFHVWLDNGFTSIMPMAYWNASGDAISPTVCLDWNAQHGVPPDKSQVMLDGYTHGMPHSWQEYADQIRSRSGVGLSIWLSLAPAESSQWKALLEQTPRIATYAGAPDPTPSPFQPVPGRANDIGVGANGSIWAIGNTPIAGGFTIRRWTGSTWSTVAGGARRIAVGPSGNPWVVNSAGKIFRRSAGAWIGLPGLARDIGVGPNGAIWVVGTPNVAGGHPLYRWNGSGWTQIDGGAVRIAVGPNGPWIVNSAGNIFRRVGGVAGTWELMPGLATDIGVGPDGTAWVIGSAAEAGGYGIYRWNGTGWVKVPGGAVAISVGPGGPWITNVARAIFRWAP